MFTTATIGFWPRCWRIHVASSSMPSTDPPGESNSPMTAAMLWSASASSICSRIWSTDVPPDISVIMLILGARMP